MTLNQFNTMISIIEELDPTDHDQICDYGHDCEIVSAPRTKRYIHHHLSANTTVDLSVLRCHLIEDWSGV